MQRRGVLELKKNLRVTTSTRFLSVSPDSEGRSTEGRCIRGDEKEKIEREIGDKSPSLWDKSFEAVLTVEWSQETFSSTVHTRKQA